MNRIFAGTLTVFLSLYCSYSAVRGDVVIAPTEDVMTSAFFQGADQVRGFVGDARPTFRVSSDNAFNAGPETIFLQFDASDFGSFSGPVSSAILTMESVDGGFNANASPGNPFLVSAHGVALNPLTSIADNTSGGTIAARDFFNQHILAADSEAITSVDGFGTIEFNVTSLVNDWISGGNSNYFIALTGTNDPQTGNGGNGYLHGFLNNSDTASNQGFTSLRVSAVPEPSSTFALIGLGVLLVSRRRR
ncbi:MAG: PEP-CTERM sorting domain-containing protein [Planctomycetota bacterium]